MYQHSYSYANTQAAAERVQFIDVQRQANRWTFIGSGMTHERLLATLEAVSPAARRQIETLAPAFC